jgi:hypothetical protein
MLLKPGALNSLFNFVIYKSLRFKIPDYFQRDGLLGL